MNAGRDSGGGAEGHVPPGPDGPPSLHVAVVHGRDEVHFIVAGRSRGALHGALAERLEEDVDLQLWQEDAARFRVLLRAGDAAGAVELYARRVGERWDQDRIRIEKVSVA